MRASAKIAAIHANYKYTYKMNNSSVNEKKPI